MSCYTYTLFCYSTYPCVPVLGGMRSPRISSASPAQISTLQSVYNLFLCRTNTKRVSMWSPLMFALLATLCSGIVFPSFLEGLCTYLNSSYIHCIHTEGRKWNRVVLHHSFGNLWSKYTFKFDPLNEDTPEDLSKFLCLSSALAWWPAVSGSQSHHLVVPIVPGAVGKWSSKPLRDPSWGLPGGRPHNLQESIKGQS